MVPENPCQQGHEAVRVDCHMAFRGMRPSAACDRFPRRVADCPRDVVRTGALDQRGHLNRNLRF